MTEAANQTERPTVLVKIEENGDIDYFISGDVRVLTVCDHTPQDRVYEITTRDAPEVIADIIGDSPIGSKDSDPIS